MTTTRFPDKFPDKLSLEEIFQYINLFTELNEVKKLADYTKLASINSNLKRIEEIQNLLKDNTVSDSNNNNYTKKLKDNYLKKLQDERNLLGNQLRVNLFNWIDSPDIQKIKSFTQDYYIPFDQILMAASLALARIYPVNSVTPEELSLDDVYELIDSFTSKQEIKESAAFENLTLINKNLKRILELVDLLNSKSSQIIDKKSSLLEIEKLRKEFVTYLSQCMMNPVFANIVITTEKGDITFDHALYIALITLARINPFNPADSITLDEIRPENQVATMDQYQHDIETLKVWLKEKLTNPFRKDRLCERDLERIRQIIMKKFPNEKISFATGITVVGSDPAMLDTLDLLSQLQQAQITPVMPIFPYSQDFLGYQPPTLPSASWLGVAFLVNQNSLSQQTAIHRLHQLRQRQLNNIIHGNHGLLPSEAPSTRRRHQALPRISTQNNPDLPLQRLPDWLSAIAVAKLPNGYLAFAKNDNNNGEIQIINPDNNEIVHTIKEHFPIEISGIITLKNGNIAVGHFDKNANVNIYNPITYELVKTFPQGDRMLQQTMTARNNDIISSNNYYDGNVYIHNSGTGHTSLALSGHDKQINLMTTIGDQLLFVDNYGLVCSIYDNQFNLINSFICKSGIQCTCSVDDNIIFSSINNILIYNKISGLSVREFQVPNINVIRATTVLENGNILMSGSYGLIAVYTTDGQLVQQAKTNQQDIDSPLTLKAAYNKLLAMNVFSATPQQIVRDSANVNTSTATTTTSSSERLPNNPSFRVPDATLASHSSLFAGEFRLNEEMTLALNNLKDDLSVADLKHWEPHAPNEPFSTAHREALEYLIKERRLAARDAISCISGMDQDTARSLLPNSNDRMLDVD